MSDVIKITGNTMVINTSPNCIPLANTFLANATQGASCVWIFSYLGNSTITLANSQGSFTFYLPGATELVLQKQPSDTLFATVNCIANPIQKTPGGG
jgi:hypothetical protein